ncbi:MAG TPA: phosphopantetheine-binding protein [Kofleriaceae bacterium]|nr:phosphopantetheine-binding protein [Kofleriaceae bacterium]
MNTDERVLQLIRNTCPRPVELGALRPELMLRHDLGIDSIALVTVMFQFEQEFGVDLVAMEVDLSGIETVGDLLSKAREVLDRPRPV